ncbi:MAG: DMT family transporter [Rhodospirillales bacterium]
MRRYILESRRRLAALWLSLPGNVRGSLWMVLGTCLFSVSAMFIKFVGKDLPTAEIAFLRAFFGFIFILPFMLKADFQVFKVNNVGAMTGRCLCGGANLFCSFYAVTHLALATAISLSFTRPLIFIFLAVLFLGEIIRWRRWTATIIGFIGVMIMVRPGTEAFEFAAVVGILGAAFGAANHAFIKVLTKTEHQLTVLFYPTLANAIVLLVPAIYVWVMPTWQQFTMMFLVAVILAGTQACIFQAYKAGEGTAVSPFQYSRLLFGGLIGFFVFSEVPDIWTFVGALVIIGSGFYIARRQMRVRKERGQEEPPKREGA